MTRSEKIISATATVLIFALCLALYFTYIDFHSKNSAGSSKLHSADVSLNESDESQLGNNTPGNTQSNSQPTRSYLLNVVCGERKADKNLEYFIPVTLTNTSGKRVIAVSVVCIFESDYRQKIRVDIKPSQTKTIEVHSCPAAEHPNPKLKEMLEVFYDPIRVEDVIFADGSVRSNESTF